MNEQNTFNIIFGIFVLLTCRDVFYGGHSNHEPTDSNLERPSAIYDGNHHHHHHLNGVGIGAGVDGDLRTPSAGHLQGMQIVKIQYCHSCGYRQAFEEIAKMLDMRFPGIEVKGETHQPSWLRARLADLISAGRLAAVLMIFLNSNPFAYFQIETPNFYNFMLRNKTTSVVMIILVTHTIASNLYSTGAFEIFYNDMPVWSKLATQRMPTGPELIQMIQSHRSFVHQRMMPDITVGT